MEPKFSWWQIGLQSNFLGCKTGFATSSENNGHRQVFSTGINPCRNNLGHSLSYCLVWVFNPSHAAIKISINATAAEFICKNIFPIPVQIKKNYKK